MAGLNSCSNRRRPSASSRVNARDLIVARSMWGAVEVTGFVLTWHSGRRQGHRSLAPARERDIEVWSAPWSCDRLHAARYLSPPGLQDSASIQICRIGRRRAGGADSRGHAFEEGEHLSAGLIGGVGEVVVGPSSNGTWGHVGGGEIEAILPAPMADLGRSRRIADR